MVICPVKLESSKGFFHRFQELEFLSLQGITAGTAVSDDPVMCNGANLAFLKETYLKYAGNLHDELASGDDVFLLHNIKRESGNRIKWLETGAAMVITCASETIHSFIRQRARWISKAGSYSDRSTKILAIVTFVTILLLWFLLAAGICKAEFLLILLVAFILKSVPDLLILSNTTSRYRGKSLMNIFIPAEVIYPLYIITVVFFYWISRKDWSLHP